jgi:hypothetical protein
MLKKSFIFFGICSLFLGGAFYCHAQDEPDRDFPDRIPELFQNNREISLPIEKKIKKEPPKPQMGLPPGPQIETKVPLSPNPFAIMGPPYSHMAKGPNPLEQGEKHLQLLELTGARWTRNDFWWDVVQPAKDVWDFAYFDKAIKSYEKHRMNLLLILCYGSAWKGHAPDSEEEIQLFGEYVYRMVDRYNYWVKHWEIWNEPNILPFWSPKPNVEHYTRLLQVSYQRAKEADPDCVIVGGSMAGADADFLRAMYENGAKGYFDALSYHTYGNNPTEESQQKEMDILRAVMQEFNDHKPIWLTETGIYTGPAGVPEHIQAERMVKSSVRWVGLGNELIMQLTLKDWTDDPQHEDATVYRGLTHANGEPKPSFFAHRTLSEILGDKEFIGRPKIDPDIDSWLFGNARQNVLVLWTDEESQARLTLDLGVMHLFKTTLNGERSVLTSPDDNRFELEITQEPFYLEGVQEQVVLASQISAKLRQGALAVGDRGVIDFNFKNILEKPAEFQIQLRDTPDLDFSPKTAAVKLEPGARGNISISVNASSESEPSESVFFYEVTAGEIGPFTLYDNITLRSPFSVQFRPYQKINIPDASLWLDVVNLSSRPVEGRLSFKFPEGIESAPPDILEMQPGQKRLSLARFNPTQLESGSEYTFQAILDVDDRRITAETSMKVLKAPRLKKEPRLDGNLEEWQDYRKNLTANLFTEVNFNPNLLGGPEDISASGWLGWREDALYLALVVKDDHFHFPDSTVIWNFDSLQLAIDGHNDAVEGEGFDRNDYEFEIARLRDGGVMFYATQYPAGHIASIVEEECKAAIHLDREAGTLTYEIRIPATVLPSLKLEEGRVFGLSMIHNDNDKGGVTDREGWLELTEGVGYGKMPSHFYDVILWPDEEF